MMTITIPKMATPLVFIRSFLVIPMFLIGLQASLWAQSTTYFYTGKPMTGDIYNGFCQGCILTGSFTVSKPLPPNLPSPNSIQPVPIPFLVSFSFSAGPVTLDTSNTSPCNIAFDVGNCIIVQTDASGAITGWSFQLLPPSFASVPTIYSFSFVPGLGFDGVCQSDLNNPHGGAEDCASTSGDAGKWSGGTGTACDASGGVTLQKQGGPTATWGPDQYDSSDFTISEKGCALASLSMALESNGVTVDPGLLNDLLDQFGGYQTYTGLDGLKRAKVKWDTAVAIADHHLSNPPLPLKFDNLGGFKKGAAALSAVDSQICSATKPKPVIVGVNLDAITGDPGHYVLVTGKDVNGNYLIQDPGYKRTTLNQYGNKIVTRGAIHDPVDLSFLEISTGSDVDVLLKDPAGEQSGLDPYSGTTLQNIPQSAYFQDRMDTNNGDDTFTSDPTIFSTVDVRQPQTGTYLLTVHGKTSGHYAVSVDGSAIDGTTKPTVTLRGRTEPGSLVTYQLNFSGLNIVPITAPQLLGDVNGDGKVDCSDMAIVRAAFGKRVSQVGFDARADVNVDGIVNILDLATVARALPAGTACQR